MEVGKREIVSVLQRSKDAEGDYVRDGNKQDVLALESYEWHSSRR